MQQPHNHTRTVFQYVLDQKTHMPHLQSWTHDPQQYGPHVHQSWLDSGHTGAGAVSPVFSTATDAKRWALHNL